MTQKVAFTIDGVEIEGLPGQTIIEAADDAGVYIPRLCHKPGLEPFGSCRLCTVMANGRPAPACTQPISPGIMVENDTESLREHRRNIIEMMFVEGNHFCMFCEKSGNCELQAMAYRLGISSVRFPFLWPQRDIDASHPDVFIDHDRCIKCARCVRTSRDVDGKHVFQFIGRGPDKKIAVNSSGKLKDTQIEAADKAMEACPVGALMKKRIGFSVPVGKRLYDSKPIGSEIENHRQVESK